MFYGIFLISKVYRVSQGSVQVDVQLFLKTALSVKIYQTNARPTYSVPMTKSVASMAVT
jgi:hypothetical protein